jgi:hypothetical protein
LLDISDGVEFPKWFTSNAERGVRNAESDDDGRKHESEPGAVAVDLGSGISDFGSSTAGLNITTMCLDRWQTDEMKDQPAVIWEGEDGSVISQTYEGLSLTM